MKIFIDSTWGNIYDETNSRHLLKLNSHDFQGLINKILNKSQQIRLLDHDGYYTLSKKGTRILEDTILQKS